MTQEDKNTLPNTLWELIEVALKDLEACEKSDEYVIDMYCWHEPMPPNTDYEENELGMGSGGKCAVCLAGAVIARTLGGSPCEALTPGKFSVETDAKLVLLDNVRKGYFVHPGYVCLQLAFPRLTLQKANRINDLMDNMQPAWAAYDEDPVAFKEYLRTLSRALKKKGL